MNVTRQCRVVQSCVPVYSTPFQLIVTGDSPVQRIQFDGIVTVSVSFVMLHDPHGRLLLELELLDDDEDGLLGDDDGCELLLGNDDEDGCELLLLGDEDDDGNDDEEELDGGGGQLQQNIAKPKQPTVISSRSQLTGNPWHQ